MGKKYTIITDIHLGGYNQIVIDDSEYLKNNVVCLGDIDLKRCLKKDVTKVQEKIDWIKSLGIPYVCSNHEGEQGLPEFYIENNIIWIHGHQCKKNYAKYKKDCETVWKGSGYLMHYLTGIASKLIHIVQFGKNDAQRAVALAKLHGCTTICMGHYHCAYDKVVDGIRIIVLPQGVHEIEL